MESSAVAKLLEDFGSATALFSWADDTKTDLRSHFDILDEEFERLERLARFEYLDRLRKSGRCNMFESPTYLMREFHIDKREAEEVMFAWMDNKEEGK